MAELDERIAVLESEMDHVQKTTDDLLKEVRTLNESLARYRGAWGAITMIGAAIATAIGLALKFHK